MNTQTQQVPEVIEKLYQAYAAIPVPYFTSETGKTIKPNVFKGKGTIEAITQELVRIKSRESTEGKSDEQILTKKNIGIDCSGFIARLYDAYTKLMYGKHIWEYYSRPTLNPLNFIMFRIQPIISMLNADTLTSSRNTSVITQVKDARPLDLIRLSGGKHVVMIYAMHYEQGILHMIEYIQSTERVGVCKGTINVLDETASIFKQAYLPLPEKPEYDFEELLRNKMNSNGIRRPHFLETS